MSNRELKTILTGFSLILFISLYYNITKSTVDTKAENIQAVVSIITLIVSIITIYFVYKAYQSQNEQLAIQKKEIEESRNDIEFNRALDIVYKQIENTKNDFLIVDKDYEDYYKSIGTSIDFYKKIDFYLHLIYNFISNSEYLHKVLDRTKLCDVDKKFIFRTYEVNIPKKFKDLITYLVDLENIKDNYFRKMLISSMEINYLELDDLFDKTIETSIGELIKDLRKKKSKELMDGEEKIDLLLNGIKKVKDVFNIYGIIIRLEK